MTICPAKIGWDGFAAEAGGKRLSPKREGASGRYAEEHQSGSEARRRSARSRSAAW